MPLDLPLLCFLEDADNDWLAGKGNPCVNLWNFQFEFQAFAALSCLLCLGRSKAAAIFVGILAWSFGASARRFDLWWVHHSRGIALQLLLLCGLNLGQRHAPDARRVLRCGKVGGPGRNDEVGFFGLGLPFSRARSRPLDL